MTSSNYGPYELGYTRATMKITIRSKDVLKSKQIFKNFLSSDCRLQFVYMKLESLVIADKYVAVNEYPGFVQTARHVRGICRVVTASLSFIF